MFLIIRAVLIINLLIFSCTTFVKTDWVQIPHISVPVQKEVSSAFPFLAQSDMFESVIENDKYVENSKLTENLPSKEWLDYQKERFQTQMDSQEVVLSNIPNRKKTLTINSRNGVVVSKTGSVQSSSGFAVKRNITGFHDFDFKLTPSIEIPTDSSVVLNSLWIPPNDEIHLTSLKSSNKRSDSNSGASTTRTIRKPLNLTGSRKDESNLKYKKKSPQYIKPIAQMTFDSIVRFIKSIQDNIVTKTSRGIREKINSLKKFRDELLINIEDRIKSLWQNNIKRTKRGLLSGDTSVDFPSAEAALMTINFLTFAVFLIKLVLQVINTIKSKHYNYNAFGISTAETVKAITRKRNVEYVPESESDIEKFANILESVEKFHQR